MKIAQVLPVFAERDAIGNNALLWQDALAALGVRSEIFAGNAQESLLPISRPVASLAAWRASHVLYHYSTYSTTVNTVLAVRGAKKMMVYHNITPPEYFRGFSEVHVEHCRRGRESLALHRRSFNLSIADSEFNAAELRSLGYPNVTVLPLALPSPPRQGWSAAGGAPVAARRDVLDMLYVGRICPNKRILDLILAFHYIKAFALRNARLILIGHWDGFERYKAMIDDLVGELALEDVYFLGSVDDDVRDAMYHNASVFVTASEHEGFCVPVLEAWDARLPVVAVSSSALPETVGDAGILVPPAVPGLLAEAVLAVWNDDALGSELRRRGERRLQAFGFDVFLRGVAHLVETFA